METFNKFNGTFQVNAEINKKMGYTFLTQNHLAFFYCLCLLSFVKLKLKLYYSFHSAQKFHMLDRLQFNKFLMKKRTLF